MAEQTEQKEKKKKVVYTVLPKGVGGGPHGLGDPDDQSLRKVEKDVLVMKIVRERTKAEKCHAEFQAFADCCVESGMLFVFTCRGANNEMKECAKKWFRNEEFVEECTKQYLAERTEYRRTGVTKKQKEYYQRIGASFS